MKNPVNRLAANVKNNIHWHARSLLVLIPSIIPNLSKSPPTPIKIKRAIPPPILIASSIGLR